MGVKTSKRDLSTGARTSATSGRAAKVRGLESLRRALNDRTLQTETNERFEGYRYLRIRIEDVDGDEGTPAQTFYTFCKSSERETLIGKIREAARWPRELLEAKKLNLATGVSSVTLHPDGRWTPDNDPHLIKQRSYRQIIDRQLSGGREKGRGMMPETQARYERLYAQFCKSALSEGEFCTETGTKISTLKRAIRYMAKRQKGSI